MRASSAATNFAMGRVVSACSRTPGTSSPRTVEPTSRLATSYGIDGRPASAMRRTCGSMPSAAAISTRARARRASGTTSISSSGAV
jgi:hypothetical protein